MTTYRTGKRKGSITLWLFWTKMRLLGNGLNRGAIRKLIGKKYTYYRSIKSFLNHLQPIYDIPINKIKPMQIEYIINSPAEYNPNTHKPASKSSYVTLNQQQEQL